MSNHNKFPRALKALGRRGFHVEQDGNVLDISIKGHHQAHARVLLSPGECPQAKAVEQLIAFASAYHPEGGGIEGCCATPDFHAGSLVPVGSVLVSSNLVVPQAIGTDINCGMRLHVADLDIGDFEARQEEFVRLVTGDLLLGTRNLPMTPSAMAGIFQEGVLGFVASQKVRCAGLMTRAELPQLESEIDRGIELGSFSGDVRWAPENLLPQGRDFLRDPGLATLGGGNHFAEIQVVEEILAPRLAYQMGVKEGMLAMMVHSGSRAVGGHIGSRWIHKARESWPRHLKHPRSGIFPLIGELADSYLSAMNTAANYAAVNRLLLAELLRLRLREVFGAHVKAPLVNDVPHNIVLKEPNAKGQMRFVHRKGATPAHQGQALVIPGSMGHASYLAVGQGCSRFFSSASHGAGRRMSRHRVRHLKKSELGLERAHCITLKTERMIEESPASYKDIEPVMDVQEQHGLVKGVARLRPLMTFKA